MPTSVPGPVRAPSDPLLVNPTHDTLVPRSKQLVGLNVPSLVRFVECARPVPRVGGVHDPVVHDRVNSVVTLVGREVPVHGPDGDLCNDPSLDGAWTPPNSSAIAPCRSMSMSSMLSAPAAIPATRQPAFRPAFALVGAAIARRLRTRSTRPARRASDTTAPGRPATPGSLPFG